MPDPCRRHQPRRSETTTKGGPRGRWAGGSLSADLPLQVRDGRRGLWRGLVGCALAVATFGLASERVVSLQRGFDPLFGGVYAPGTTVRWRLEGDGLSRWTDHGIRRAPWLAAPGRPSVLVLGDSFTEALQVSDHEVFTTLAEERLAQLGRPAAVLNAGEAGRSAADYVGLAAAYRSTFSPDWVVVQLAAEDLLAEAWDGAKTHFTRDPRTGKLLAAPRPLVAPERRAFPARAAHVFANLCGLTRFTALRALEFREWLRHEPRWFSAGTRSGGGADGAAASSRAYPVEEELAALLAAYDGKVTLLLLDPFDPSGRAPASETFARIERFAAARGASVVRLRDGFAALERSGRAPYGFPDSGFNRGHLNAAGHRIAGRLLADELERVLPR